jgi:plasmid stabilization system protein ParE
MAGGKVIGGAGAVFSVEVSLKYEKNLQAALDYTLQHWGATVMVKLYLQIVKEVDKLAFFPYANAQNRFLDDVRYREITLRKYPFVITYRVGENTVRIINIIHASRNPTLRKAKR